ncbi:hypothetical protein CPB86DRAFT_785398 [Serendipita vermifera]|nr:hypothetical protein CPB86DRAFT_785398 [Serendipita vermifera]
MIFPTALVLGLLSITPVFATPLTDDIANELIARDEPQSLEARAEQFSFDLDMFDKRDLADEETFELVARSPEPEPEPEPEPFPMPFPGATAADLEDMERRGVFGIGFKVAKVLGKAAWNYYKSKHHKRDEEVDGPIVLKRDELVEILQERDFDDFELEVRDFDEDMELEARSFDEPEIEERSFDEEEFDEFVL